jgi:hypothetical protein
MKSPTVVLAAGLVFSTGIFAQKPVVLISGSGNLSIDSNNAGAGLTQTTISKHDQTMEMAQDFLQFCSSSEITLDQATVPDYFVFLNRKGSPSLFGEIGQSQIMVLNRKKSVIFVAKKGTVKNAVKHACNAVAEDWQAHGRVAGPGTATADALPAQTPQAKPTGLAAEQETTQVPNLPPTLAVVIQPTASAQKYCKPETISAVLTDTTAYLTSKGMTLGTTATSSHALVLILNRPVSKWIEITVQERDHAGSVLWSEKVSDGGWGHLGTTGLLNTLEKVHKIIDAKMPESRASTPEAGSKKN